MTVLAATTSGGADLGIFGHDPWWLIIIKTVVIFVFLMLTTIMMIWAERRIIGRMQQRPGPNRVGPFGTGQGLADGVKLMLKEDLIPAIVDRPLYILAPLAAAIPAFLSFAVIPIGPTVSIAAHHTPLQLTDLATVVGAYALWSQKQWAYALTYYWGLVLSTQALVSPALQSPDFPHYQFLAFWAIHLLVVWAAI